MAQRIILMALASLLIAGCQNTPQIQTGENAEVIDGHLVRVDNTNATLVYVDPSAHFEKYTAIMLAPLGVDNVEIVQPVTSSRLPGYRNWELTDKDKERLQKAFQESMVQQLSGTDGFPVVTSIGDNVLLITARLTRIQPKAAKDDNRSRPVGRSVVVSEGAGKLSVEVTFSDSETGEVLALAKDTRSGSSHWGINNSVTNAAEVKRVFNSWARQITAQLQNVHSRVNSGTAGD